MLDLRNKQLPNAIQGDDGVVFMIDTSFRTWIEFDRALREDGEISDCVLKGKPESDSWKDAAVAFLWNPNITPNYPNSEHTRAIDYVQDGEYIYASFMQAYGIDLTVTELHWWQFKALLTGLPKDSKMAEIIGYRTYKKSGKKPEQLWHEEKRAWTLPEPGHDKALAEAREIAAMMYERQNGESNG